MSGYQFNEDNSNQTGRGSFFQEEGKALFSPTPVDANQVQAPAQQKQRWTADDLINQVMSITPAKPVYDAQRPEEIKRLMKANALSEAFRTMGETFSLAKGGTVNRREPNQTNSQYQNALWNTIDNYNQKTDAWNNQEYMNKVRKGLTKLDQFNKDKQMDFNRSKLNYDAYKDTRDFDLKGKQLDSTNELKKAQQEATKAYQEGTLNLRKGQIDVDRERAAETARHNQAIEGIHEKRAEGASKTPILYDDQGNEVLRLRPSEEQKLMGIILNDPAAQSELALLKPTLGEPLSAENKKYLIAKYWNKFPASIQYVNQLTGTETNIPQPTAPGTQATQDTSKPKINYNALVF